MSKPPPDRTLGNVGAFTALLAPVAMCTWSICGRSQNLSPDQPESIFAWIRA
ncbi:MAG: hypothetical protein VXZ49_11230 [Planctomycetota bacterium]|nr:hypothetical protein [Planctomycetota bacterium]